MRGGGLAGLVVTIAADTAVLTDEDAATLRTRMNAADLDNATKTTSATPDAQTYAITVESGETKQTFAVAEGDVTPEIHALINWIETLPAHERSVRPPG